MLFLCEVQQKVVHMGLKGLKRIQPTFFIFRILAAL